MKGIKNLHRVFNYALRLAEDGEFFHFQNDLAQAAYDSLGQSYKAGENEIAIVTKLVNALNGRTYNHITVEANKIHGNRSFVEFNYRDKPTTKELGDMAVISIVTVGKNRLLQRVCIIQNKKAKKHAWGVDAEQLFLLKNFPPLSGNRGLFRGMSDVTFRNRSGCLGAYGLFDDPGEMMFLAAPLFAEILRDRSSVSLADIGIPSATSQVGVHSAFPVTPFGHFFDPKEWYMIMREVIHRIGPFPWRVLGLGLPFFGNVHYGLDIYDFVRAWTQVNLGEYTCLAGVTVNPDVDGFANRLIRSAGLGQGIDLPKVNDDLDTKPEGDMAVFVLRMDVEQND
ncbi:MAG: hypothetical protein LLG43_14615 [Deltaproteobacteria bacterium]|nr:hypothetical protein [Deltaproteobacteria bacterium]